MISVEGISDALHIIYQIHLLKYHNFYVSLINLEQASFNFILVVLYNDVKTQMKNNSKKKNYYTTTSWVSTTNQKRFL